MGLHFVILVVCEHVVDTGDDDAFFDVERMAGSSLTHRVQAVGWGGGLAGPLYQLIFLGAECWGH